jgi:hypothetical protein
LCDDAESSLEAAGDDGSLSSRLERVGNLASGRGTRGQFEEDADTMGDEITAAWKDYEGLDGEFWETWRFSLQQEDGRWRVCDVSLRDRRPATQQELHGTGG